MLVRRLLLLLLLLLHVMVLLMLVVMVALGPDTLTLPPSPLLLVIAGTAESPAVLLVPSTQWLAAKCEIVILNDGGDHPGVAAEFNLSDGWVGDA